MPDITAAAVVLTKDEEANIARCLDSLEGFAQVFVVDSRSADRTREVAAARGAVVVDFDWNRRYPKKKQWALENLPFEHDWVLYVDADEELTPELRDEIARVLGDGPRHAAYFVSYDDVFLGRTLRHGHRSLKLVLLDRRRVRYDEYPDLDVEHMWEVEGHYQPTVDGTTGMLRARARHHDAKSLYHWLARHNRYSDWEARLRRRRAVAGRAEAQRGARSELKRVFDRLPAKGAAFFLYSYVLRLGFLDGRAGFHFATAKAFYYWQVGAKMRELEVDEASAGVPAADGSAR